MILCNYDFICKQDDRVNDVRHQFAKTFSTFSIAKKGNKESWRTKQCFAEIITDFDKYFQRKKRLFLKRRYYVFLEPAKLSCLSWIFYWSHRIFGWAVRFLHEVGIILVIEHCPFHMRYNLALHFAKNLSQHWIGYFSPINSFFSPFSSFKRSNHSCGRWWLQYHKRV